MTSLDPSSQQSSTRRRWLRDDDGVLFALPEYEAPARSVVFVAVDALARANHPLLARIPRVPVAAVRSTRVTSEEGTALQLSPIPVRAELEIDIHRVVAGELDGVVAVLARLAEQEARALLGGMFERLNAVTDAAGTTVDADGRPLSHELVLELLETMEIDFDAEGNAELALVGNSDMVRRLQALPPMTPEQEAAFDALMARKRRDFEARQRKRRLG